MMILINENDPVRHEIAKRAVALGITGNPDKPVHALGTVTLIDGRQVAAYVIHAADPVITDGKVVVMLNRTNPPGIGLSALPGGFIDPLADGRAEDAVTTAAREAKEEAGITVSDGVLIGQRILNRPFDMRVVTRAMPDYGLHVGDVFTVSTQGVLFYTPELMTLTLTAGDDAAAGSARRVPVMDITPATLGVADHYGIIREAMKMVPAS